MASASFVPKLNTRAPMAPQSSEYQALLWALAIGKDPVRDDAFRRALEAGLDWTRLLSLARRHRVAGSLLHYLKSHCLHLVPVDARNRLEAHRATIIAQNLRLTAQLALILDQFSRAGIRAVAFKGPTLASIAYGDLGLREFSDLDLLVGRGDIERAITILASLDFQPRVDVPKSCARRFFASENALGLRRASDRCLVELHWSLTPRYIGFHQDLDEICDSSARANPGGKPMSTLAPEFLLLFLCVHASKHYWERLAWLSDIAHLTVASPPLDWDRLLIEAEQSGSFRMLLLGLVLARDLLGAPVPASVAARADADRVAWRLARATRLRLACDASTPMNNIERLFFHVRMRERLRDRLKYAYHLALTPSARDYDALRLPTSLSVLYGPIRPFRLIWEYTGLGRRQ
jgi:Uncharacterised nucleotidyltransferase